MFLVLRYARYWSTMMVVMVIFSDGAWCFVQHLCMTDLEIRATMRKRVEKGSRVERAEECCKKVTITPKSKDD